MAIMLIRAFLSYIMRRLCMKKILKASWTVNAYQKNLDQIRNAKKPHQKMAKLMANIKTEL